VYKKKKKDDGRKEGIYMIFLTFYVRGIPWAVILLGWNWMSTKGVLRSEHKSDCETVNLVAQILHLPF